MQIIMAMDSSQRAELEEMIMDLEEENRSVSLNLVVYEGVLNKRNNEKGCNSPVVSYQCLLGRPFG